MPSANYPVTRIGQYETHHIPVSFETNEVGAFSLPALGYRTKPVGFASVVCKTVAGSNDGTIKLHKVSTELASITVAASAAIGDEDSDTSITEAVFEATDQYKLTTAKSTAGGRAIVALTVEILPSH
jgi:hypothetical protein